MKIERLRVEIADAIYRKIHMVDDSTGAYYQDESSVRLADRIILRLSILASEENRPEEELADAILGLWL